MLGVEQVKPLIVIEHLEEHLSKWLMAEYRNAARIAGQRLVITNLWRSEWREKIRRFLNVRCYRESIVELEGVLYTSQERLAVLDPQAEARMTPSAAAESEAIVIGGILGDHPPRGRTRLLLSSRLPRARKYNIGDHQFSIDGSVYVALKLVEGRRLDQIPVVIGLKISVESPHGLPVEVELPYAYPVDEKGKPVHPPELPRLIASGLAYEEYHELTW